MKKPILTIIIISFLLGACISKNNTENLGNEGAILFEKGDVKGALSKFEKIIKLNDNIAEAHLRKGDCLDLLGDIEGSISSYTRAIEIEPKNKIAIYNRALSYENLGDLKKTISDYRRAIQVDPANISELNSKLIYHNLGIIYGQENKFDKAIEAFSKAIEIDNQYADAYYNLGYAYQLQGNHEKAIEEFDKAINIDPNNRDYKEAKNRSLKKIK